MIEKLCQFSSLPVLIIDSSGRAVTINRAFQLYWNADPVKVIGPDGYNVFEDEPLGRRGMVERLREAMLGFPVQFEPTEYRFPMQYCLKRAGVTSLRTVSLFAIPLPDSSDTHSLALFYYDEAMSSSIQTLERQCEQLKILAESVMDLKHEINNPLLLIIGHAQLMLAKADKLPHEAIRKLEKILNSAEKIRIIIQQHQELTGSLLERETAEIGD